MHSSLSLVSAQPNPFEKQVMRQNSKVLRFVMQVRTEHDIGKLINNITLCLLAIPIKGLTKISRRVKHEYDGCVEKRLNDKRRRI